MTGITLHDPDNAYGGSVYNGVPAVIVLRGNGGDVALVYVPSEKTLVMAIDRDGQWVFNTLNVELEIDDDRYMEFYMRVAH